MTLNVYLLIPENTDFEDLTEAQQQGIRDIFGQYVMPMPGTQAYDGTVICDAICDDTFNPEAMSPLGLTWEIIGMWREDGTNIVPLNQTKFTERLLSESPTLHQPHQWSGWPRWDT